MSPSSTTRARISYRSIAAELGISLHAASYLGRRLGLTGRGCPLTEEDREAILAAHAAGPRRVLTYKSIARELQIAPETVWWYANRLGLTGSRRVLTEEDREAIMGAFAAARPTRRPISYDTLAREMGVSPKTAWRCAKRLGISVGTGSLTEADRAAILAAHATRTTPGRPPRTR